ncbi:MAG: DUF6377 domain-containing protein [Clostridium sp.]|nr:DUF6377 domain-containing protein [Clostridium sp.]
MKNVLSILLTAVATALLHTSPVSADNAADSCRRLYDSGLEPTLKQWSDIRKNREMYIETALGDALTAGRALLAVESDSLFAVGAYQLGETYSTLNLDSAALYYGLAAARADSASLDQLALLARAQRISLMPLKHIFSESVAEFERLSPAILTDTLAKVEFYHCAHRLYRTVCSNTAIDTLRASAEAKRIAACDTLLRLTNGSSPLHNLMRGMSYLREGKPKLSVAAFSMALDSCEVGSDAYSMACILISQFDQEGENRNNRLLYALRASIAQMIDANLCGMADLVLSERFESEGEYLDAFECVSATVDDAQKARNVLLTIRSADRYYDLGRKMPMLFRGRQRAAMWWLFAAALVIILDMVLRLTGYLSRHGARRRAAGLQATDACPEPVSHPEPATESTTAHRLDVREFMREGLLLQERNMEAFDKLIRTFGNKLSAGAVDDVRRMMKPSVQNEQFAQRFLETFDHLFLAQYPGFIDEINSMLQPDRRITDIPEGRLNNEIRVYALMRLGIDDTQTIATLLGVGVNTIYTYRNKMRQRAIDRDTFVRKIRGTDLPEK